MSYSVRVMGKEDIAQVTDIEREAFPTQWPPANYHRELQNRLAHYIVACDEEKTTKQPEAKVHSEEVTPSLASKLKRFFTGDYFLGNKLPPSGRQYIIGFAGLWVMTDEAHITNIAARQAYRRQGIGELLLISIIDLATELNARIITLEVRASNTIAQNLYSKYGFTQADVRQGYYTNDREDAILMSTESITSAPFQARLQQLKRAHAAKLGIPSINLPTNHPLTDSYPAQPGSQ